MATSSLTNFTVPLGNAGQSPSTQGLLMPKLSYRFRVTFLNFGVTTNTTQLTLQAMTFGRPHVSFDEQVIDIYNSKVKYLGKYTWSDTSISLRDDAQGQVSQLVGQQVQKQFDFNQQSSAASGIDYKFQTLIEVLDGGNAESDPVVLETWNLYGCAIKEADYGDMDYKSSEPMTIKLTIMFDNALQSPLTQGIGFPVTRTEGSIAI